ncbi:flagellar assembly protein FliH [Paenibacillus sp. ACRRX]|nr:MULTISPECIES: FliH/SctL family protein [unclassified Paenibacillus]MCG7407496.1 flagellar assembly protein FliH [Paenibacillus sp. ACRRX]MDK8180732.1 FliH/SctL family protein [Paenibacillus sp. UMB4589-SE434]
MSNVIKSSHYIPVEQMRMLEAVRRHQERLLEQQEQADEEELTGDNLLAKDTQLAALRQDILADAQAFAEDQVRVASEQSEQMLEDARAEIEAWWDERRTQDDELRSEIQQQAQTEGYEAGVSQAEQAIKEAYELKVSEAGELLKQAYAAKDQLIQEAEPFVVSLSCSIAEKIIDQQLTVQPELILEMVKKQLSRKRESGVITLCVSPAQFMFIHAAREELSIAIDSQAELQIIPDGSVQDHGCVIRSSLGSIDARIDTQLEELKKALIQVAVHHGEHVNDEI